MYLIWGYFPVISLEWGPLHGLPGKETSFYSAMVRDSYLSGILKTKRRGKNHPVNKSTFFVHLLFRRFTHFQTVSFFLTSCVVNWILIYIIIQFIFVVALTGLWPQGVVGSRRSASPRGEAIWSSLSCT